MKKLYLQPLLILFAIGIICRDYGPLSTALSSVITTACLLLYHCSTVPLKHERWISLPGAVIAAGAIALGNYSILQLGLLCLYLFSMLVYARTRVYDSIPHGTALLTTLLFFFAYFCYRYFPQGWYTADYLAGLFSTLYTYIFTRQLQFGPTGCGLFIVLVFLLYNVVIFYAGQKSKRTTMRFLVAVGFVLLAAITWVELSLVTEYIFKKQKIYLYRNQLHGQAVLFLLLSCCVFINRPILLKPLSLWPGKIQAAAAAVVLVVLGTAVFLHTWPANSGSETQKTVLFYKHGALDWDTAKFGKYGQRSGGMFGLMPKYLRSADFTSRIIEKLTPVELANADVLVMINLNRELTKKELFTVWQFVRHGGGLLLLGDHTDLAGHMKNFNKVLMHVPLKLKFDSAMPSRYTWDNLMEIRPHPITNGHGYAVKRSWWVGASLQCDYPAVPLVVGKYCYSDKGYKNNPEKAYLGNRRFDSYERLNDNVLAAIVPYGKGRIMVCGDTSAYHNTVFMTTHYFIRHTMNVLGDRTGRTPVLPDAVLKIVIIFALIALIFLCMVYRPHGLIPVIAALLIAVIVVCSEYVERNRYAYDIPLSNLKVAFLDYTHGERFDIMSWEDDSIGGLRNNLFRNGFWPFLLKDFKREDLLQAKALIIIAPTQPFSAEEIATVQDFVEKGGKLLVAVGHEEAAAAAPLLHSFGFAIDNTPLGRCTDSFIFNKKEYDVTFHEAWPVIFNQADNATVLSRPLDFPAAVTAQYGKGRITVIGDSCFLLNENLEGDKKYTMANILFLRDILIR